MTALMPIVIRGRMTPLSVREFLMNVTDALVSRYTARAFLPEPVDRETVTAILEAATRAPSWANTQPWEIFVASGECLERLRRAHAERIEAGVERAPDVAAPREWPAAHQARIAELRALRTRLTGAASAPQGGFFGAPVVVFLCMDRGLTQWSMFDLGALSQSVMLAGREHGLDSAVAFNFAAYPDLVRAELEIPDELALVIGIALGHADPQSPQNVARSTRRPLAEVVRWIE